jgi:hypothetical protein
MKAQPADQCVHGIDVVASRGALRSPPGVQRRLACVGDGLEAPVAGPIRRGEEFFFSQDRQPPGGAAAEPLRRR